MQIRLNESIYAEIGDEQEKAIHDTFLMCGCL